MKSIQDATKKLLPQEKTFEITTRANKEPHLEYPDKMIISELLSINFVDDDGLVWGVYGEKYIDKDDPDKSWPVEQPTARFTTGKSLWLFEEGKSFDDIPNKKDLFSTTLNMTLEEIVIPCDGSTMIEIAMGIGERTRQGDWQSVQGLKSDYIKSLCDMRIGSKNGPNMCQGGLYDGIRDGDHAAHNAIMSFDIDVGLEKADLKKLLDEYGCEYVFHSTHSHMRNTTKISREAYEKAGYKEVTEELLTEYCCTEKNYCKNVVETLEIVSNRGKFINIAHNGISKWRVIVFLSEKYCLPESGSRKAELALWSEKYFGVARLLGLEKYADISCGDVSHFFHFPRHQAKSTAHSVEYSPGTLFDLDDVEGVAKKDFNKKDKKKKAKKYDGFFDTDDNKQYFYKEFNVKKWKARYGKVFMIQDALEDRGEIAFRGDRSKGGVIIECPFDGLHGNPGDEKDVGAFVLNAEDNTEFGDKGYFWIHCSHTHDHDQIELLIEMLEAGHLELEDLTDDQFLSDEPEPDDNALEEQKPVKPESEDKDKEELKGVAFINETRLFDTITSKIIYRKKGSDGIKFYPKTYHDTRLELRGHFDMVRVKGKTTKKKVLWLDMWLDDFEQRKTVQKFEFDPSKPASWKVGDDIIYNTFDDFALALALAGKPDPGGSWKLMKDFILEIICAGNKEHYHYLLMFISHILKFPGEKPPLSLVLRGMQGIGKTFFCEMIVELIGERYACEIQGEKSLTSKRIEHLAERVLIVCDEANLSTKANMETLKFMISAKKLEITPLYQATRFVKSCGRIFICSNSDSVLSFITMDTFRRYLILQVSDSWHLPGGADVADMRRKQDFFKAMSDQMRKHGGLEKMFFDLMQFKPSDHDLQWSDLAQAPLTDATLAEIQGSVKGAKEMLVEFGIEGKFKEVTRHGDVDSTPAIELNEHKQTLVPCTLLRDHLRIRIDRSKGANENQSSKVLYKTIREVLNCGKAKNIDHTVEGLDWPKQVDCFRVPAMTSLKPFMILKGYYKNDDDYEENDAKVTELFG